jgi:hypothetical protein
LKATDWFQTLTLEYQSWFQNVPFKFNLRHYIAGIATVLSLHLRQTFPSVRVWAIEPPGGLLSAELAHACREWYGDVQAECSLPVA